MVFVLVVERYERSFEQFRQETEQAIATCRREFNDIRKKFEKLRRIRRSLVIRFVEPGSSSRMDNDTDGPPPQRRKRWGKKSTARRRPNILDWCSSGCRTKSSTVRRVRKCQREGRLAGETVSITFCGVWLWIFGKIMLLSVFI